MTRRIHIVGSSTRSGTTLLFASILAAFEVDSWAQHEQSLFRWPPTEASIHLSRRPNNVHVVGRALQFDPCLYVLHLVRDPRDVVVSRHGKAPDRYWTTLRHWKAGHRSFQAIGEHPRLLSIRYEDLVTAPGMVLARLEEFLPFLERREGAVFGPSEETDRETDLALRGARPIDDQSIGSWRGEKARLAAQLALHGSVQTHLVDLGYEVDDAWKRELVGVEPDNGQSHHADHRPTRTRWRQVTRRRLALLAYRAVAIARSGRGPGC